MYVVDEFADEPIMLLDRHIGMDETDGMGIDGSLFQRELLYMDGLGKKCIKLWMNSPGGTVIDGFNMFNAILKSKTKVDTYCMGLCASMAAVVFQAGRKRIMADYGILMFHNPFGGSNDDGTEAMRKAIVTMIASRSGMTEEKVAEMMNRTTFMGAEEAKSLGLCDEIEASEDYNKRRLVAVANNARGYYGESKNILNNILTQKNTSMKKVTNKLGLNEAANEDAIVEGIATIQNSLKEKDAEIARLKKEKGEVDTKLTEITNKHTALEAQVNTSIDNVKKTNASALVKTAVDAKKIKNDATLIAAWEAKAVADFDGTKALLDSITGTVNAAAPNIVKDATKVAPESADKNTMSIENAVAQDMLRIRNKYSEKK
jgi:ATP-dependent Clp endopeptidase proteolytic subunit ClpP